MKQFKIAAGTVTGSKHMKIGRNNQDAYEYYKSDNLIVAVIADGCGSCDHSEVGSKLAVKLFTKAIVTAFIQNPTHCIAKLLDKAKKDLLSHINLLSNAIGAHPIVAIQDFFLFTLVGVIITEEETVTFSIGDGVIIVNGEVEEIGPFPDNEPPYLAYELSGSTITDKKPQLLDITIHRSLTTTELESVLIGSDGVSELIQAEHKSFPGKDKKVGPISQFWEKDSYFSNPDLIRRKLFLANSEKKIIDWQTKEVSNDYGLLTDDTTIIAIKSVS